MRNRRAFGALVAISMVALLVPTGSAGAGGERGRSSEGIRFVSPDEMKGRTLDVSRPAQVNARPVAGSGRVAVGDEKLWLASDFTGSDYTKEYTLRGKSEHLEIWSASDSDEVSTGLKFPEGDCRNDDPARIKVTKKQVRSFKRQFERKIYPRMSRNFSRPVLRNGEDAVLQQYLDKKTKRQYGIDAKYWQGSGKRIVVLIDNIRDENFYDTDNANTLSRVAGFHYGLFNEYFDRNVMTIDSFNWLANTTATPPHEPNPDDPCTNFPANPFQYEATFAHEYLHLLGYYADPDGESTWLDEGLADWAQTITGYAKPEAPLDSIYYDSHVQCFLGYLEQQAEYNPIPAENCGPENSLTAWGDQTDNEIEILADYGAAYTFTEMLFGRFGRDFLKAVHKDDANSFASLNKLLPAEGTSKTAIDLVHEWLVSMAVDKLLDGGATLTGGDAATYQVPTLNAQVDWFNDDAYMTPGAPPNGGDFVLARKNDTQYLGADKIDSITFNGAEELASDPLAWTVDTEERAGNAALYSGKGDNLDNSMVREVTVPAGSPTLSFETKYNTEYDWDYGFVQVSTDGGKTYKSLANASTKADSDPGAIDVIKDELPGLTGESGVPASEELSNPDAAEWVTESFDLSAYAGQTVLLSFRYMTDPAVTEPGWWIDNVKVNDTVISDGSDLAAWRSATEINPDDVAGFTVQLVSWTADGTQVRVGQLPLNAQFEGTLGGAELDAIIGTTAENVGIIVTQDDPTAEQQKYAAYTLQVDNFDQPGGE